MPVWRFQAFREWAKGQQSGQGCGLFGYEELSLILSCREDGHRQGLLEEAPVQFSPKGLGIDGIG